jgi:hypothetical protein
VSYARRFWYSVWYDETVFDGAAVLGAVTSGA